MIIVDSGAAQHWQWNRTSTIGKGMELGEVWFHVNDSNILWIQLMFTPLYKVTATRNMIQSMTRDNMFIFTLCKGKLPPQDLSYNVVDSPNLTNRCWKRLNTQVGVLQVRGFRNAPTRSRRRLISFVGIDGKRGRCPRSGTCRTVPTMLKCLRTWNEEKGSLICYSNGSRH
jgi:hypothetical protein